MHEPEDDTPRSDDQRAAERGAALIAAAMAHPEARAPQSLREALTTPRPVPATPRRWPRRTRLAAAAGLALAAVLALVVALGGDGNGTGSTAGPTVAQVAALGRLPAREGPPRRVGGTLPRLAASVEGLAFPDWSGRSGWSASGQREDRVAGRAVTTVFYRSRTGARLGYSIVAGRPVRAPSGGAVLRRGGLTYRVHRAGGRTVVSWTQGGHTCVLDGPPSVPYGHLVRLASWAAV